MLFQLNFSIRKVSPHQAVLHIVAFRWQLDSLLCSVHEKKYNYYKPKEWYQRGTY